MDNSAVLQSPPLSVGFFCSCDKVYHKQEVRYSLYLLAPTVLLKWSLTAGELSNTLTAKQGIIRYHCHCVFDKTRPRIVARISLFVCFKPGKRCLVCMRNCQISWVIQVLIKTKHDMNRMAAILSLVGLCFAWITLKN